MLTLSRPGRRNMWTVTMEDEFYAGLDRAASDDRVRVIVVTGAGQDFCPGLDPDVLDSIRGGSRYTTNRRPQTYATTVPKPVIGAINGACAGIGLAQALCFDYRFAVDGAKFTTAFSKRGLPAEDASAWMLTRLVGPAHALDLLASGRVFTAEEAHAPGRGAAGSAGRARCSTDAVAYARATGRRGLPGRDGDDQEPGVAGLRDHHGAGAGACAVPADARRRRSPTSRRASGRWWRSGLRASSPTSP